MAVKRIGELVVCAAKHWVGDNASTLGAALAFYSAFSLAPLLVLLVSLAGWAVGEDAAYGYVGQQLTSLFGPATAEILIEAARNSKTGEGAIAAAISVATLLIGASTVFAALDSALELIWGSKVQASGGFRGFLRSRLISFGFILAIGFLLLVSLTLSTALVSLRTAVLSGHEGWIVLTAAIDVGLSLALGAGLFALVFRYMPSQRIEWRSILVGALVTAALFQLGRWGIGWYLSRSTQPSAFGAASAFVALLLWLYYSAQIFLYGAEFTSCLAGLRTQAATSKPRSA